MVGNKWKAINLALFSTQFDSVKLLRKSANTGTAFMGEQNAIFFQIMSNPARVLLTKSKGNTIKTFGTCTHESPELQAVLEIPLKGFLAKS